MALTRSSHDIIIDGDVEAVFRLVSEIHKWAALFPHVRSVTPLADHSVEASLSWHMLPIAVRCFQNVLPVARQVEQQYASRLGWRAVCRWTVSEAVDNQTRLTVVTEPQHGPGLVLGRVATDLVEQTLAMIRLLAEADRKAHEGIT